MEEHSPPAPPEIYRCPDERYTINRAVHLSRLAAFYPACRECPHCEDTHTLAPAQVRAWAEVRNRASQGPRFTAEELASDVPNEIDRVTVSRLAFALACELWKDISSRQPTPSVVIGSDGHWTSAEHLAVACQTLQSAGCRALEAGAVTTAALVAAAHRSHVSAALWIGNASGRLHATSLRLWGPGGQPWSSPGALDVLRASYDAGSDRPRRRGGGLARAEGPETYLATLASMFFGLRPLRFVLDTTCEPLVRYFHWLNRQSACDLLRPDRSHALARPADQDRSFAEVRAARLSQTVVAQTAHFGLWIDGAGERCQLFDEQGVAVADETLLVCLGAYVASQQPGVTVAVESTASREVEAVLRAHGVGIARADFTRQAMHQAMCESRAAFGGAGGRFWYGSEPPAPDALLTLCLLLTLLSQSDQPLSSVLDAAQQVR